jgi:hypothetical protein
MRAASLGHRARESMSHLKNQPLAAPRTELALDRWRAH